MGATTAVLALDFAESNEYLIRIDLAILTFSPEGPEGPMGPGFPSVPYKTKHTGVR